MLKSALGDPNVLLRIRMIQEKMNEVIDGRDAEDIVKDEKAVDLLTFYLLKIAALQKGISKKTLESIHDLFRPSVDVMLTNSLIYSYTTVAPIEVVKYALHMADESQMSNVVEVYTQLNGK